jgi:NitT/TauT family transport system substrate-binding protein
LQQEVAGRNPTATGYNQATIAQQVVDTAGGGGNIMKKYILAAMLLFVAASAARAESKQVRIVMPYGLGYLPTYVAIDQGLIEKHAKAAGLGDIKVTLVHMASGPASSDLLLAGDADLAMGGFGPAFVLWDKTRGANKVRIVTPQSSSPIWLLSNDPRIRTIRDFGPNDRIAVTAIKVTAQALSLQMAAAKEYGWDHRFRFDSNMVTMSNPDGLVMLLSGAGAVRSQSAIIPFSVEAMESGKVHLVMNSEDYLEPGSSISVLYGAAGFHDGSPKLYAATAAAFEEAFDFIHQHPREAAEIYVAREPQKRELAWIEAMIVDPKLILYRSTPRGLKKHADFMFDAGTLKTRPDSWKDLVWDNLWNKDGS